MMVVLALMRVRETLEHVGPNEGSHISLHQARRERLYSYSTSGL
jgi:hypothetical protein